MSKRCKDPFDESPWKVRGKTQQQRIKKKKQESKSRKTNQKR